MIDQKLVQDVANNYVKMWIEHDSKRYENCEKLIFEVNKILFPDISEKNLQIASKYLIEAFKIHDDVEEGKKLDEYLNEAETKIREYYLILKIPEETAKYTINVWRSHHLKNTSNLISSLVKEQTNISKRITNDVKYAIVLAGLWFVGAAAHDIRDINSGLKVMNTYFKILISNQRNRK